MLETRLNRNKMFTCFKHILNSSKRSSLFCFIAVNVSDATTYTSCFVINYSLVVDFYFASLKQSKLS